MGARGVAFGFLFTVILPTTPRGESGQAGHFEGPFGFDKEIRMDLEAKGVSQWKTAKVFWVRFEEIAGKVVATIHMRREKGKDRCWRLRIGLVNPRGKEVARADEVIETHEDYCNFHLPLGRVPEEAAATRFTFLLEDVGDDAMPTIEASFRAWPPLGDLALHVQVDGKPPAGRSSPRVTLWRPHDPSKRPRMYYPLCLLHGSAHWRNWNDKILWCDTATGRTWEPVTWINPDENSRFDGLPPGEYRFSVSPNPKERPFTASRVIRLDGSKQVTVVNIATSKQKTAPMTLKFVDAQSGEPVPYASFALLRSDGLPWGFHWNGNFFHSAGENGEYSFGALIPGTYRVTARRRSYELEQSDYKTAGDGVHIEVRRWRRNVVEVPLQPVPRDRADIEERWPHVIEGIVTDNYGRPIGGVEVWVSAGYRRLTRQATVLTGPDGQFSLRFRGYGMMGWHEDAHQWTHGGSAYVHAKKLGYLDATPWRNPYLSVTEGTAPEPTSETVPRKDDRVVLYTNRPYWKNLVMVPSAAVRGRLVDETGWPVADQNIGISYATSKREKDRRASGWAKTDKDGRFAFDASPYRSPWFMIHLDQVNIWRPAEGKPLWSRERRKEQVKLESRPVALRWPGEYEVELVCDFDANRLSADLVSSPAASAEKPAPTGQRGRFEAPLEFDEDLPARLYVGRATAKDLANLYPREDTATLLAHQLRRQSVVEGMAIRFERNGDAVRARLQVAVLFIVEAKWRVAVDLLDAKDRTLAQSAAVFATTTEGLRGDGPRGRIDYLDFPFGHVDGLSAATGFRITIARAAEDTTVTTLLSSHPSPAERPHTTAASTTDPDALDGPVN